MKNENSREELISLIKKKLFNSSNEEFKSKVQDFMTQEGRFTIADYKKLVMKSVELDSLKDFELYWFAYAMELIGNQVEQKVYVCKVSDYFTPVEIKNSKFFSRDDIKIDDLYVLHNVVQLSSNQYSCIMSVQQLAESKRKGIIRVTPELQRESKSIKNSEGTEILKQIEINKKKVREIEEKIANDRYHYNMIRLNLINDGLSSYTYDEENKCIYLPKDGDIIIPDGNHRSLGAEYAYSNYPELRDLFANRYFEIAFTFYDIDTVKDMISQEWKATPPNTRHKETMERNYANRIVEWIKIDPNAEDVYKRNITTTGIERGFIVQITLANAIQKYYNVNSFSLNSQAQKVKDWLVEFYNYLSEVMIDDFKDYELARKTKWSTEAVTWVGYTYLSKQLENDLNWRNKLESLLKSINWRKTVSPIERKATDEVKIEKYFISKWGEQL
jgi:hypothetical protein